MMRSIKDSEKWLETTSHPSCRYTFLNAGVYTGSVPPRPWMWPERTLSTHLCYFVLKGGCLGEIQGQPFQLEEDSLLWLQPGVPYHARQNPDLAPIQHLYLRFHVSLRNCTLRLQQPFYLLPAADNLRALIREIIRETSSVDAQTETQYRVRALMTLFFCGIFEESVRSEPSARKLNRHQRMNIEASLAAKPEQRCTPLALARQTGLSSRYFALLFRNTYGVSPRIWIKRQRIRLAADRLLESNLTVSELAHAFGYKDVFLFSRQFKQVTGLSPRSYRNAAGS